VFTVILAPSLGVPVSSLHDMYALIQFNEGRVWNGVVVSISLDGDGRLTANLGIVSFSCKNNL
jgi:hypothetical protein